MEDRRELLVVAVAGPPVTVAAPEVGAEEPVVAKERWEQIRRLHEAGMNVSQIARRA